MKFNCVVTPVKFEASLGYMRHGLKRSGGGGDLQKYEYLQ